MPVVNRDLLESLSAAGQLQSNRVPYHYWLSGGQTNSPFNSVSLKIEMVRNGIDLSVVITDFHEMILKYNKMSGKWGDPILFSYGYGYNTSINHICDVSNGSNSPTVIYITSLSGEEFGYVSFLIFGNGSAGGRIAQLQVNKAPNSIECKSQIEGGLTGTAEIDGNYIKVTIMANYFSGLVMGNQKNFKAYTQKKPT